MSQSVAKEDSNLPADQYPTLNSYLNFDPETNIADIFVPGTHAVPYPSLPAFLAVVRHYLKDITTKHSCNAPVFVRS